MVTLKVEFSSSQYWNTKKIFNKRINRRGVDVTVTLKVNEKTNNIISRYRECLYVNHIEIPTIETKRHIYLQKA